jgi:hypothetical protein
MAATRPLTAGLWPMPRLRPFLFLAPLALLATNADARIITCVGEAISGRAIGGGQARTSDSADSAIGDNCFFFSNSSIGRHINKVCPIRNEDVSDKPGPICWAKAVIVRKSDVNVIERIIRVRRATAPP